LEASGNHILLPFLYDRRHFAVVLFYGGVVVIVDVVICV